MFDPIGSMLAALAEFFSGMASTLSGWYTDAVKATIAFLMSSSLPSQEDIESDFFRVSFGGMVGLALYLVTAIAILVLLVFLLTPRKDHSLQFSRFAGSVVGLMLYAILFFRLYVYVDNVTKGLMQVALNFITSTPNGTVEMVNGLLTVASPSGVGSVVVLGIFAVIFCWFAAAIAFCIKMMVIVIFIIYPLLIVLRPLGMIAVTAFNAANSFLIVALLAPIVMVWAFALPLVMRNIIPGADALGLTAILTLVCSGGALFTPLVLLLVFFRLSSQVFGRIDVQGQMAITSLPPLSWDEAQRDMQETRRSPVKDSFNRVAGSMLEDGSTVSSLIKSIPDVAVHAASAAATAYAGPVAGMVIETVHVKVKESYATKKANALEIESAPAQPQQPPQTPQREDSNE